VDLPGYGYTVKSKGKDEAFISLITDYLQEVQELKFAFLVIDASVGLTKLDGIMSTFLQKAKIPFAIILNKTDKTKPGLTLKLKRALEEEFPGVTLLTHAVSDKRSRVAIVELMEKQL
jgi:GTP-binding protein EngB required for normal cell division